MDSDTVLNMFGTFQMFAKSATVDPLLITKRLQRIQEKLKKHLNILSCISQHVETRFSKLWKVWDSEIE